MRNTELLTAAKSLLLLKGLASRLVFFTLIGCALLQSGCRCHQQDTARAKNNSTDSQQHNRGLPPPPNVSKPPKDAISHANGLFSKILQSGKGQVPTGHDIVKVHYTGWTTDGKMFDSSITTNKPAVLYVSKVIPGLGQGLQLMQPGEKRRLWIPEKLAYAGAKHQPKGMLVFEVELLEVTQVPETPKNLQIPTDASQGKNGLAWQILTRGTGTEHPQLTSRVKVHYSGWTEDGNMFGSSIKQGKPLTFTVNQVIAGWQQGLQLMVAGEKRRFWVPRKLGYRDKPGPKGDLVFDLELLEILQ